MFKRISLYSLRLLWAELGKIPINADGIIQEPFNPYVNDVVFPKGTNRENIFHWFEDMNPLFSVHEAMYGKEKAQ